MEHVTENVTLGGYTLRDIKALQQEIERLRWIKQLPEYETLLAKAAVMKAEVALSKAQSELSEAKQTLDVVTKRNAVAQAAKLC